MKPIKEFLSEIAALDIKLWVEGNKLRCNAPQGVLTQEIRSQLSDCKAEIIKFLEYSYLPLIPRSHRSDEPLPLSWAQERLWFLNQLEGSTANYNIPVAMHITGKFDINTLQQTLSEIIRRHEILRTGFQTVNGTPVQVIYSQATMNLNRVDLQHLLPTERETIQNQLVQTEAITPFNLETAPLIRCSVLHLSSDEYVLLLTMHHIVSDAWSMGVFIQELCVLYQVFCAGVPSPLPELPIQYTDFAIWQRQWLSGSVLETQLNYWRSQLHGAPELLQLPTDRSRPVVQTYWGRNQIWTINTDLTQKLQSLSRELGTTLFITLLVVFATLLYRYSGQSDILIGSAIANRNRSEIEPLIGFFVNILVLRTSFKDNPTVKCLLAQVTETTLKAYEHQDVPFEQVVEALQPQRSLSHSPLFQVAFTLQNTPMGELELPGVTWSQLAQETTIAKFDLTLSMTETDQGLVGGWEYNTDLFDESTIERMAGHFQNLLTAIVENPVATVDELPLLSEAELHQLLRDWNNTQSEYPTDKCIHQLFEEQVQKTPLSVAVILENQQLTYLQLNQRANQLAHYLQTLGVGSEVLVGICVERSVEMLVGLLGILKAGGAYVPLDPHYPLERLSYILVDSGVEVLLTQQKLLSSLPSHTARIICLDTDWGSIEEHNKENLNIEIYSDNLAYVIYTSGSTGQSKGVAIEHLSLCNLAQAQRNLFDVQPTSRIIQFASISFDASVWEIFMAVTYGATLILGTASSLAPGDDLKQIIHREKVTHVTLPPSALAVLPTDELPDLSQVILAGEACPLELANQWSVGRRFFNAYGPTESTVCATVAQISDASEKITIGRPIANTQIYILDNNSQPVPIGVPGELHIGGAGLARGYLNRPELTAEKFIRNPWSQDPDSRLYKTGDLARYLPNGNIEYLGRIDYQVKIRGFRIELGEIEASLSQHPDILSVVVIAREDIPGDKRLIAYLVVNQQLTPNISQLRQFLMQKLPEYMIPSAFVYLDSLPLTPNGKVDRRNLPAPEFNRQLEVGYVAPRNPVEEMLAQIWADVLRVEQVGIHDNFFSLGGHSLLTTQLISRVRTTFKVELPLRSLFELATIAELAGCIHKLQQDVSTLSIPLIQAVTREQAIPLSFAQQRLWFLDQLEPNNAAYNIPGGLRLQGELNFTALEQSLREIIHRHEALRTNFVTQNGQTVQIIHPADDYQLELIDLQHLQPFEQEQEIQRLISTRAKQPFDLEKDQLVRAIILKVEPTQHILLLTMHHIVSDGWSMGILVNEMTVLYQALCQGQPSPLAQLTIQYADFAIWQREWLTGEVKQSQITYWQRQMAGVPALLELPTDRPRPPVQTWKGAHQSFTLPVSLSDALNNLSRQAEVTLFMTLLAGLNILLYRYTEQTDIVVGSPIANRNRSEIEGLIGFFVNTLVLRSNLSDNPSFEELLQQVREMTLAAYAHQDLPFEMLVETLQPERNLSHTPLFQVMLVLQNAPISEIELPGLIVSPLVDENFTAKFDLTLSFEESADGLLGSWEYNTDLFEDGTISRMTGHLVTLLSAIVANPQERISQLPLLTATEQQQVIVEWNDTEVEYPQEQCIHQLFEKQVERTPDAVAVVFENQQLTYQELNCRANQLAHHLKSLGVGADVLVGLCVERSPLMIVGLLGILKAGGAYVPLDPEYPEDRLHFMLEDAQVRVLLTQQHLIEQLPEHKAHLVYFDELQEFTQANEISFSSEVKPSNLAYVLYTSGSTGRPKAVAIEHHSPVALVSWAQQVFTPSELAGVLASTSICFDLSVFELFVTLSLGGKVILAENAVHLSTITTANQVTLINTVPSAIAQLIRENNLPEQVCTVNLAGEFLQNQLVQQIYQHSQVARVFNLYGPSEDTTYSTFSWIKKGATDSTTIGRPIANTQVYILDEYLQLVPLGVPGELHIGGAGLARGYLNRPELTQEKFIPNPFEEVGASRLYKTGDLARYLPDGNIEYLGRVDNQVKIRGFRIELGEIEASLSQHPNVLSVVVIAREDIPGDKRLVAYLVVNQQLTPNISQLRQFLSQKLPEYMIPSAFVYLDSLPLTPNGKVDRRNLPVPEFNRLLTVDYVAPRNSIEQILVSIWIDLLKVKQVGIHDNFFTLGGHSLLAVQLVAQIQQQFGKHLSLASLFQYSTIAQLATVLSESSESIYLLNWEPLVAINSSGSKIPFFCVPGAGANALYLYKLAHYLGQEQPFYALQPLGLDGESQPHTKVEEMAAYYVQAIQSLQPGGPYLIGGHSFGGIVAFEIAQQLQKLGYEVPLLAILDSAPETEIQEKFASDDAFLLTAIVASLEESFGKSLGISYDILKTLDSDEQLNYCRQRVEEANVLPNNMGIKQIRGYLQVYKTQLQVKYKPKEIYPNEITCFVATETSDKSSDTSEALWDARLDWDKFSSKKTNIHFVPGGHLTMAFEPYVQVLGERLRTCIEQAQKFD